MRFLYYIYERETVGKDFYMKDYLNFSGKNVIVIGGRRGIGRAISIAFAERGAKVAVVAGNPDGSEILDELFKAGTSGLYYCCDLCNPEKRKGLIQRITAGCRTF